MSRNTARKEKQKKNKEGYWVMQSFLRYKYTQKE